MVHIDFGDCFEVAMLRDKLPEKVPFRLTRMLINAMEISGLEGNFRITCRAVMELLREHKQSVMAVLEALAYDPLMNWRLLEEEEQEQTSTAATAKAAATANDADGAAAGSEPDGASSGKRRSAVSFPETASSGKGSVAVNGSLNPKRVTFDRNKKGAASSSSSGAVPNEEAESQQIHELHALSLQSRDTADSSTRSRSNRRSTSNTMSYSRRQRMSSLWMPRDWEDTDSRDIVNKKALQVLQRVSMKLRGREFADRKWREIQNEEDGPRRSRHKNEGVANVDEQVQRLFIEATNHENLSQAYLGWCPLW